MSTNSLEEYQTYLEESLKYGFIHNINYSNTTYAPKILMNNPATGQYVLTDIQNEINKSLSFCINVAFVTEAGIGMIKSQLSDFAQRGGKGKLIVSPYLGFNNPKALSELLKLKNVEVRIAEDAINSHAKMYLFNHGIEQVAIVGSSNLTHNALKLNYEWNIKLSSTNNGDFIFNSYREFDRVWNQSQVLTLSLIENYERLIFKKVNLSSTIREQNQNYLKQIYPNQMQNLALKGLEEIRKTGADRALIISATGTGKTYLSAFDVKVYQPQKFLFIVHREQILRKAQLDYQKVIGFKDEETCIYRSGMNLDNKRYIFTTIQTLQKEENYSSFNPDYFDYMLVDEVHKAGAKSYKKIIDYFEPKFLLGMTATPERTDDNNIYELFNYNIAYEIRLQSALKEDMLCPFLYFGVTEFYQGEELLDKNLSFSNLVNEDRIDYIIEKVNYYGYSGEKLRGLMFCSSKNEARELSKLFNQRGYRTCALTGEDSPERRELKVKELENGELDYILTVDIFNEGIDIPSVNQIIMLRNTKSNIVFVQQLGRGLRKHSSKEFVTIIDFIGNYQNNYMIPIALFGDQSMNKDNYRRKLVNRNQIQGVTTINFEEIAQKHIFDSISRTNISSFNILKEAYLELENRLGRVPLLKDYIEQGSIDPIVFFETKFDNYGQFLIRMKKEDYINNNEYAAKVLTFLSKELLDGKRKNELLLIKWMIENDYQLSIDEFKNRLQNKNISIDEHQLRSIINIVTYDFFTQANQRKYGNDFVKLKGSTLTMDDCFIKSCDNSKYLILVNDVIETGLLRSVRYLEDKMLTVGEKYSRKDVCRLLAWEKDESSTMYGYKVKHNTCPIFVTYHKSNDISESTQYRDRFINEQLFHWYTRSNRSLKSKEVQNIINHQSNGIEIHLFVKKEDGEGKDFYYIGPVDVITESVKEKNMAADGNELPVVTMDLKLNDPISYNLFHYFVEN